ncbi:E3 ubiquitin-protein ligase UPL1 [Pelomyxa schiedti]|nr:E3 ubiquitin-protein ligase UPL1 [Pelomyxa schiedti]
MKIKKPTTHTHPSSHVRQITAHLHKLPDTQLLQELPKHTCTLKQWRESKRFDSIMARCIPQAPAVVPSTTQTSESSSTPVLEIARFSNEEERLLVWHILEFTRELLHCSTSNNFYASHDRLQSLLLCDDDEIVVEALCVLGQLLADPHSVVHTNAALSQVLSELARGWGGKQNCAPLGLFLSVEAPNDVPESVTTLHLEFLKTPEKTASSSPSPKVTIIHIPKLHQLQETSLSIFNATVARFAVPPQLHIPLYIRIRFIKSSAKKQSLLMWALIRLLAKNTLLCGRFARSAEDIEVVDEMADVLKCGPIEGLNGRGESYLSMLRVMCLRLMTVLCTEAAQNGQSFLEQILTACGCNAHNGLLPSLIRKSVSLIVASTTTSVQDPLFNADFIFELFKFVRAIAENTAGAQALHLSGSFSSMAPLIRVQTIDFYSLLPQICSIFETWLSSKHSNAATLHDIGFIEDLISRISVELKGLLTQPLPFTGIPAAEAATSAETATSLSGTEGTSTERGQPTPSKDIFCSPKATKAVIQSMFRVLLLMLPQSLMSIVQAEELPTLLAIVFKNPQVLGDRLLCLASKTFSRILNEEPTAYATLESLEVPKSFLSVLSSPDFPQYPWFMSVVPSVISALCLSKKALTGILEAHCVEEFFEKMISPKVVVSMDSRTVSRLSLGLADLSRHYSEFKPLVSQVCLTILGRVTKIAEDVASGAPQREQEERERKAQYKRDKEKVSSCASTVSNEPAKDLNTVPPVSSTSSTVSTSVKEGDNETTSIYQHRQASKKGVTGCHYCGKDRSGAICGPISGPNCEKCQLIDVEEGIIPYDQQVQTCDTPAFLWVFSSFSSCLLEGIFSVQENASSFINNGGVVALTKLAGTPFPPIFFSQNQAHPALFDNVFHCLVTRAPQILQGVIASLHQTFELLSKTVVGWENGTLYFHKILPQVEPPLAMINHTTNILNGLLHDSYGNKALQLMSEWVTPIGTEVFSKLGLLQRLLFSDMSAFKLEHKRADYPPILSLSGLALHALSSALSLALTIPVGRHQNDKPLHTLSLGFSKTWCNHLSWANQVPEASRHGYLRYVLEALKLMLFDDRHKTHTLFLYHLRRAGFFTLLSEQLSWAINYEGSEKQGKQRTKTLCSFADLFQRTMDKESVMSAEVTAQMLTQKLPDLTGSFDPHEFVSSVQGELSSIVYTVWGGGSVIEKHLPPALAALAFESIKFHLMQEMEESKVKLQTKDKSKSAFPETVITQLQAWKVLPKGTSIPRITDWLLNNPPEVKEDDDLAAAIAMSLVSVTPASSTTAPSAPYTGPPIPEEELIGMDDEELAMALSLSQEQPPGASSETPIKLSSSTNPPPIVPLPSIQETSTTTTTPSTATSSTVTASTTSSADVLPLTNPRYILNALLDLLRQNYDIASVFSSVVDIFITIAKRSNEDSVSVLSLLLEALQPNPDPVPESTSAQLQETSTVLLLLTSLLPSLREVFDTAPHLYTKTLSVVQSLVEYTLPKDTDVEDIKLLASKWAAFGAALRVLDAIVSGATVDISLATQLLTSSITALRKSILNSYASRCALILIARLTMDYDVACKFVQIGGVEALLNCTVFSTTEPKHVSACAFHALTIIRHVLEDPQFLQTTMESHIKSSLSARVPIQQFLEQMAPLCLRNKPIFLASVRNLCELDRSGGIKLRPLKAGLAPSSTSATEIHSPTSVPVITNSPTQSSSSVQSSDTAPNISGDSKPQENAVSTEKLSEEKKPDDMSTDKSKASELQSQIIAQFISRVQTSLGSTKTDAESRKITPLFNFTKVLELLYEILKSSNSLVDTLLHCSGATFLHKLLDEVLQQIDERALAVTTPLLSTLCSTEQGCKCVAQEISSFLEGEITGMEYGSMVLPTRLFKLIEICNYLFTLPPQFSNILLEFLVKGKAISLLTVALDKLEPSVCGTTTLVQSIVHVMEVLVRNTLYKPNPPVAPTSTSAATGASLYSLLSAGGRPPPSANTFRDILSAELSSGSNSWNTVEFDPEGISNTAGLRISSREYNRFGGPRLINDARLPVLQPFEPLEVPVNPSIPTFTSTPSASASTSASTTPSLAPVRLESAALPSGEAAMEVDASSRFPEISSIIRHLEMDADGLSSDAGARGTDEDENEEDEDDEDEENNDGENQSAAEGNESPVSDYEDEEDNSVESSLSAILDPLQQSRVPSWTRMPRSSSPLAARMMEETALLRRLHTLERGVNMLASEELRIQRTSQPQLTRASMWTADGSAPTERQIRDLQSLEAEIITAVQVTQPSMEIKDSSKAPQPLPSDITSMWTEALAQVSRGSSPPPQHLTSDTSAPELRTPTTSNIPQLSVRTPTESGTSTNSLMEALHASLEQIFASNTTNSQSQLASGSQTSSPISPAQVTEVPTPIPPVVIPAPIPPTPAINQAAPNVLSPAPVPGL